MNESKGIPKEIIEELKTVETKPLVETTPLIQDTKYTQQFSLKLPFRIIDSLEWKNGDSIRLEVIEGGKALKLCKEKS
jgi:hypothetical protein